MADFMVIGGGLAGCECAVHLARQGHGVTMYEQKPGHFSPAHQSAGLAELVCSNSFRSDDALGSGVALLKEEMRALQSAVMEAAKLCRVPAGKALAVDRDEFSRVMSEMVAGQENIRLVREQVASLDDSRLQGADAVILAAGPLISDNLAASLQKAVEEAAEEDARTSGEKLRAASLYFYDAIAPIISADSLDRSIIFAGSRYGQDGAAEEGDKPGQEEGDYLNCPMTREEYDVFYAALMQGERVAAKDFEKEIHFEGCMPIEALAERGPKTLTFGPFKPVGFEDPRSGRRPWALVQLRAENKAKSAYNLVGCQTKLTYGAQAEIFRKIPGLEKAEFLRFGSMHRNTYVNAPAVLADLELKSRPGLFLAGQISGVEGYVESAACGLWLGHVLAARAAGRTLPPPPPETALGGLMRHLQTRVKKFQPSNAHFGLMPELEERARKKDRKEAYARRAREAFQTWLRAW